MTKVLDEKLKKIEQCNRDMETKESHMQLLLKAKEHKDKHCAILVNQKEKLMQQIDQLTTGPKQQP